MTTVLLEGAGGPRPGFDSYLIEVDSAGKATITKHRDVLFRPGEVGPSEPRNLGDWATPGITTLPTINWSSVSFQLRITHTTKPISAQLIEHDRLSVVERIVKGQVRDSLIVYESHRKLPPENGGSGSASSRGVAGRIVDRNVRFASYNARDTARTAHDSISPAAMRLNGVPAPPDSARLTGSILRIEPLGVELTLPPAWFGARDSTMRPTCGDIIRGTPDQRFVTARPMLDSLRSADGEWDREYSSVVDSILPFGDLVAQVGPEPFGRKLGANCFLDLQMRVYVLPTAQAWDDSVRRAPLTLGLTTARRFFASAVLASTDSVRWHIDWLHWDAWYTDYGSDANVQLYSTAIQDRTLVLVFMRAAWGGGAEDEQRFILQHVRFF